MLDRPTQTWSMPPRQMTPLVMLPGTLCDGRVFAETLRLAGALEAQTVEYRAASNAAEMARLILSRAPRQFGLVGFSLGAIVALEIIAQAPERVDRLALIGADAGPMPEAKARGRRAAYESARYAGPAQFIDAMWEASVPVGRREDRALRATLYAMAQATPLDEFSNQVEISITRADSRPRLAAIAVPTLVLCGAQDRICPPDQSREIAANIAGARLAIIADAGHYVTLDQPQAVATEFRAWLAAPAVLQELSS